LADRDLEPATQDELIQNEPDTQDRIADLFQRAYETANLISLDGIRSRALGDNSAAGIPKGVAERALKVIMASSSVLPNRPLRRRIQRTLEIIRQYRQTPPPEAQP
jgi:hypothetical protein